MIIDACLTSTFLRHRSPSRSHARPFCFIGIVLAIFRFFELGCSLPIDFLSQFNALRCEQGSKATKMDYMFFTPVSPERFCKIAWTNEGDLKNINIT